MKTKANVEVMRPSNPALTYDVQQKRTADQLVPMRTTYPSTTKKWSSLFLSTLFVGMLAPQAQAFSYPSWWPFKPAKNASLQDKKLGKIEVRTAEAETLELQKNVEFIKDRRRSSGLLPFSVDSEYNAQVFQVSGAKAGGVDYYLAPTLFVFEVQNNKYYKDKDGNVTVTFHTAFIDGTEKYILGPNGKQFEVPDKYLVKDLDKLKNLLKNADISNSRNKELNQATVGMPGCPSSIILNSPQGKFDVTPSKIIEADYCRLNRVMSFSVMMSAEAAERLLTYDVAIGDVYFTALYQTMAPVPVSKVNASFDRKRLYQLIKAELQGSNLTTKVEISARIESLIKESAMHIYIQGDYNAQMKKIVDNVIDHFFEKFELKGNESEVPKSSCDKNNCISLKVVDVKENETLTVSWEQAENFLFEKKVYLQGHVPRMGEIQLTVGRDGNNGSSKLPYFANRDYISKEQEVFVKSWSLGDLHLEENSRIDFDLTLIQQEQRGAAEYLDRKIWDRECTGRNPLPPFDCTWTEYYHHYYSQDISEEKTGKIEWTVQKGHPISTPVPTISAMDVYFDFETINGPERIICDLSNLYDRDELLFVMQISNTDNCKIFNGIRKKIKGMGLIYKGEFNSSYEVGERYESRYQKPWNSYVRKTYSPIIALAFKLTVRRPPIVFYNK